MFYSGALSRICKYVSRMWEIGIKRSLDEMNPFRLLIDVAIILLWGLCIYSYSSTLLVNLTGIGIIYGFLSKSIFIDEGFIFVDILMPIVTVLVFYGSVLLYSVFPMLSLLFAILVVPAMTNQIADRYSNYIVNVNNEEELITTAIFLYSMLIGMIDLFYSIIMYRTMGSVKSHVL